MFNFTKMKKTLVFGSVLLATVSVSGVVMADTIPAPIPGKVTTPPGLPSHETQCSGGCNMNLPIPEGFVKTKQIAPTATNIQIPESANVDSFLRSLNESTTNSITSPSTSSNASDLGNLAPAAGGDAISQADACSQEAFANSALNEMGLFAGGGPTAETCAGPQAQVEG